MRCLARGILLTLLFAGLAGAVEPDYSFVSRGEGNIPLILSAPHGGWLQPADVTMPTINAYGPDVLTYELAETTLATLREELGVEPYFVFATFARRWIDANREPLSIEAWQDMNAEKYYEGYHQSLRDYIAAILDRWGGGLLVDIHGQSAHPNIVHRGTRNGLTVAALLAGPHGMDGLTGPHSLFGNLGAAGYEVFPPNDAPLNDPPEVSNFDGGYIVLTYGSQHLAGLDAIQLEIGRDLRAESGPGHYAVIGADLGRAAGDCRLSFYPVDTPAHLLRFTPVPVAGGVTVSWETAGGTAGDFRLLRRHEGAVAEVSWHYNGPGRYLARDEAPCLAHGGRVIYTLRSRSMGVWRTLREESLLLPASSPGPILSVHPHPVTGEARVNLSLAEAGRACLAVFDTSGRRVATLAEGSLPAGDREIVWDGCDARGRPLSAGVYMLSFTGPVGHRAKKIVVLR